MKDNSPFSAAKRSAQPYANQEENRLLAAKIVKPQGIKGEVKLAPLTDLPETLLRVKEFFIGGITRETERIRANGGFVYLKLKGIDDRTVAETLRDQDVYTDKKSLPPLPAGSYYIADLLGADVTDGENLLGKLADVLQHGGTDVYYVKGGKNFMFPAAPGVLGEIDPLKRVIFVNAKELVKVAVYED
jgi:16S rRNA processing protein RimM